MKDIQKIEKAIEIAGTIPDGDINSWLSAYCAGDQSLRAEIESLLRFRQESTDFLEHSAGSYAAQILDGKPDASAGKKIGVYTIVRELGRGGMGTVYLAERSDGEFRRRVAIKIISRTFVDHELERQFRRERQILAQLEHPNIARLFDGGVTEAGEPFLVMEYINGNTLTRDANKRDLNVAARLNLFLKICRAVSFAHQNLIVHRDIKPSNILVDESGEPRLLDFGLAKVFDEAMSDDERTQTAIRALTPAYASPEQLRGVTVTTASDIYSLGVVLYELLSGQRPYDFPSNNFEEILRIISIREPSKPSVALAKSTASGSENRQGHEINIAHLYLKGDLDNIVLMALRKEPERRYKSVDQFVEDIERFLRKLPVIAQEDTLLYRSSKFVQRNAVGVFAGALIGIATVAGTVISRRQARRADAERERAERRFDDLRQLSNSLMFEIHDSVQNLPGSTKTRQLIVSRAIRYLDSLAKEASDDLSLQRELATAYKKVGDIQGNPYSSNLGDIVGAMHTYNSARQIYEDLIENEPRNLEARRELATVYDRIGEVRLHASDTKGGFDAFESSLAIRRQLLRNSGNDSVLQREVAVSMMKLGEASQKLGDIKSALEFEEQALSMFETLARRNPNDLTCKRDVMLALSKIGYMLFLSESLSDSLKAYRRAFDIAQSLTLAQPDNAQAQRDLSVTYNNIGRVLLKVENAQQAEDAFLQSLLIADTLAQIDPKNELARSDLAYVLAKLGTAQTKSGKYEEALQSLNKALDINEALYKSNPKHAFTLAEIGDCHHAIGETYERMGQYSDAVTSYQRAVESRDAMSSADPEDAEYLRSLLESLRTLGRLNIELADSSTDKEHAAKFWQAGRQNYELSLQLWNQLKARGFLTKSDLLGKENDCRQMDRCIVAIKKIGYRFIGP